MTGWTVTQLSFGTDAGRFHSHSYYDIPVLHEDGRRIVAYRTSFVGRHPMPADVVEIGLLDTDDPGAWKPIGTSSAWSWQQGPMAQWVPGLDQVVWNDRGADGFITRLWDMRTGRMTTLPRPLYALAPGGDFGLSLDMGRLERLRPGYGYAVAPPHPALAHHPEDSGVWRVPLSGSDPTLIVSLATARHWLLKQLPLHARVRHMVGRFSYWFNHAKISPDGERFTVKLRWRRPGGPWTNAQGVSLTADMEGRALHLLADATSHVIWQTNDTAYLWREGELALFRDEAPHGRQIGVIGGGMIDRNVHMRHLPPGADPAPSAYVFDTPYAPQVDLCLLDPESNAVRRIARFEGHEPPRGPFRCDLHPVPNRSGRKLIVTSLQDGGRQVYLVARDD